MAAYPRRTCPESGGGADDPIRVADGALASEVRTFVREALAAAVAGPSAEDGVKALENAAALLPGSGCSANDRFGGTDFRRASQLFITCHYSRFAAALLSGLTAHRAGGLPPSEKTTLLLKKIFLHGNHRDSFLVLLHSLCSSKPGYQLSRSVGLLEEFLEQHRLRDVIWGECEVFKSRDQPASGTVTGHSCFLWQELITGIAALPDKTANKLQNQNSNLFYPRTYILLLASDLLHVLEKVHNSLKSSKDTSLEFVSQLIGKLSISGFGDTLWSSLVPVLSVRVKNDYIWCRICERIVTGIPSRCLESVLIPVLTMLPWYGVVGKFLGDAVVKNPKVQYLLCTKLLLLRFFEQVHMLQNVIGYLASSPTRRPLCLKALRDLLTVWGDGSAIRHTSYEQHFYISQALIICISFLSDKDKEQHKQEFLQLLMYGMQNHLGSSDVKTRILGMVVAEILTSSVDPDGEKLKFEYEKNEDVKKLLSLSMPPKEPQESVSSLSVERDSMENIEEDDADERMVKTEDSDLDSDDDLVPYDLSNDKAVLKVKPPRYIRDCMDGLISADDGERVEICLHATETLIRSNPDGLAEIAAEFAKILLHLSNSFSSITFSTPRFKALVALMVKCPIETSDYLTREFYDRNYNLRQRLDMLEVIAAAAQELSRPKDESFSGSESDQRTEVIEPQAEPETWQEIVQRRIDRKTRRFGQGKTKPQPKPIVNRFSAVAGHFFYPLLRHYDRKENTFDLLGEDSLVLGRLLYTLGIVMYAAANTVAARQMGKSLLEFIWVLRYHSDPSVRQALAFSLSMTYLSLPAHMLLSDLQEDVIESKRWLQDLMEKDPNRRCQELAVQALLLLENIVFKEFNKER